MSTSIEDSPGFRINRNWMQELDMKPFDFQKETWQSMENGFSGLVNAPTGYGKTYSVFLGTVIRFINEHSDDYQKLENSGLQLIWVTPLRALAKDIARAMKEALEQLNIPWKIGIRNGDTDNKERQRQKRQMPEILIITPESLHLILAQKNNKEIFRTVKTLAVDEWHELIGSKRGVQVELAIAAILHAAESFVQIWGISATIGNLEQAMEVLLHPLLSSKKSVIIVAKIQKDIIIESIYPDEIEKYPWAGHLGIKLAHKIIPIIDKSKTTLIFINTRGMSEMWYQALLDEAPHLAGSIALHHGSIEQELRIWVEDALHAGKLKAVVCTASLDLGVDFRPVETVIQVGSPKGVARFLQRAGRSGHQPGKSSIIYFLPTHSLELIEVASLKEAIKENTIESKEPMILCFDVLIQFMGTMAIGDG
ncbi:MAG: DEAD/DEAH box helicase, partial [Chitinophagaceae bacterium]